MSTQSLAEMTDNIEEPLFMLYEGSTVTVDDKVTHIPLNGHKDCGRRINFADFIQILAISDHWIPSTDSTSFYLFACDSGSCVYVIETKELPRELDVPLLITKYKQGEITLF